MSIVGWSYREGLGDSKNVEGHHVGHTNSVLDNTKKEWFFKVNTN